jgi:4-coumarate--CoA ligase
MSAFEPKGFLQNIQDEKVTRVYIVPPIMVFLAKHPLVDQFNLKSIKSMFSGAAPLGGELTKAVSQRLGVTDIRQGYGMTEMSPVSHIQIEGTASKYGTIGRLIPNTVCKVVDPETNEVLGSGKPGELWIKGPQVMKGYLNNPEATAATLDKDGFLHTGDIGYFDADGDFFIVDRLKELIKVKGFQVAPAELEALLLTHEAVADVAVIPVPDDDAGEAPKAFVVLKKGFEATTEEQIKSFVAGTVAPHKKIKFVEFIEAIPKSPSGKILRRILKDKEKEKKAKSA